MSKQGPSFDYGMKGNERFVNFHETAPLTAAVNRLTRETRRFKEQNETVRGVRPHCSLKTCPRCERAIVREAQRRGVVSVRGGSTFERLVEVIAKRYETVSPCGAPRSLSSNFVRRVLEANRKEITVKKSDPRGLEAALRAYKEAQSETGSAQMLRKVRDKADEADVPLASFRDDVRRKKSLHRLMNHDALTEPEKCRTCAEVFGDGWDDEDPYHFDEFGNDVSDDPYYDGDLYDVDGNPKPDDWDESEGRRRVRLADEDAATPGASDSGSSPFTGISRDAEEEKRAKPAVGMRVESDAVKFFRASQRDPVEAEAAYPKRPASLRSVREALGRFKRASEDEALFAKEEVNYRYAPDPETASCGNCKFFDGVGSCAIVAGAIRAVDLCDRFTPRGEK